MGSTQAYHSVDSALCLASRGYAVFPLAPGTKVPLAGSHGSHDATDDVQAIRQWWAPWPDSNIGVVTGHGLAVLDVDPRHGGNDAIDRLERRYGRLPDAPRVRSGGDDGGWHLWYQTAGDARTRSVAPGVELRALGGYVVAPASVHPSGRTYRWAHDGEPPRLAELPQAPDWLLDPQALPARPAAEPRPRGAPARAGQRSALGDALARAVQDPVTVPFVLTTMGIPADVWPADVPGGVTRSIICPLGCGERHPSASLWRHPETALVLLRSWHACRGLEFLTLPMIFAGQSGAGWQWLAGPELAAWTLRLLVAAGVVPTVPEIGLPGAPRTAAIAHGAFRQTIAASAALGVGDAAPFTRRFGAALTGLSTDEVRHGWEWLRERAVVVEAAARVGRGAATWRPGDEGTGLRPKEVFP